MAKTKQRYTVVGEDRNATRPWLVQAYKIWVEDGWTREILAAVVGTALIVALCVTVVQHDNQPEPNYGSFNGSTITLNTIVSALLTFAIPALMMPVAESISQLKWSRYKHRAHPLSDLQYFDNASRGVLGSVEFVVHPRKLSYASIGALLTIAQLLVQPLAQNTLSASLRNVQDYESEGAVASVQSYWIEEISQSIIVPPQFEPSATHEQTQAGKYAGSGNTLTISSGMKGAIQSGLFYGKGQMPPMQVQCVGNCSIDQYWTLGVCSSVKDVTANIVNKTDGDGWNVTLPSGPCLSDAFTISNVSSITTSDPLEGQLDFNNSLAFAGDANDTAPIADVYILWWDGPWAREGQSPFHAVEFVLRWCNLELHSTVESGKQNTNVIEALPYFGRSEDGELIVGENMTYSIDSPTHESLQNYLGNLLSGYNFVIGEQIGNLTYASSDVAELLYSPFSHASGLDPDSAMDELGRVLSNTATSMTNFIRSQPSNSTDRSGAVGPQQIRGTLFTPTSFVQVDRRYLAVPILFAAPCDLFFLGFLISYVRSRENIKAWKSSVFPLLRALHTEDAAAQEGMTSLSMLQEEADSTAVKLQKQLHGDWRLKEVDR